jgi:release factor glutamine methyltransferase
MTLVTEGAAALARAGVRESRLDAELLLADAAGCPRLALYVRDGDPGREARARYADLLERRAAGTPVAYLLGEKEFFSLPLYVRPGVLIPRPETETLVEVVLAWLGEGDTRIADVGTGSGNVAIALAANRPDLFVCATDISPDALAIARENVDRHGLADRVALVKGDLFAASGAPAGVPEMGDSPYSTASMPVNRDGPHFLYRPRSLDAVVSNPPYIPTAECTGLPREIREHEPWRALDGGPDGLAVIRRLVAESPRLLRRGGLLAFEVAVGQADSAARVVDESGAFGPARTTPDLAGIPRVVAAEAR